VLESKIEDTFAALPDLAGETAAFEAVDATYRRVHGIVGIGPTVGFAAPGRAARTVENMLLRPHEAERGLTAEEVASFRNAVGHEGNEALSVVAMTIDRFEGHRSAHGDQAANGVMSQVARAVRRLAANIGIIAASYRNGMIILVAPEFGANSARELAEALHGTVSRLRLPISETVAADHVTASVATVTGLVKGSIERVHLLTQAIAKVQDAAGAGGNRVLALTV
jgi:GGDEF domain-containing protein